MSMKDCILAKAAAGKVDETLARQAADLFDEIEAEARKTMSSADAAAYAGRQTAAQARSALAREQANRARQAAVAAAVRRHIESFETQGLLTGKRRRDPGKGALSILSRDPMDRVGFDDVEGVYSAVLGRAHALADQLLAELRPRRAGLVRRHPVMDNIVRELFGATTDDPHAAALARAWTEASEMLRRRYNQAGGGIRHRVDWGLPQRHDRTAIDAAGFEAWRAEVLPRLDHSQMLDDATGLPMSPQRMELVLRDVFDSIVTGGWARREPRSRPSGAGALANRRQDRRVLIFKTPDDWLAYQKRFGAANLHDVMVSHLDDMAMDIARLEVLGPNPAATIAFMKQVVEKAAGTGTAADRRRAAGSIVAIERVNDELSGRALIPVNDLVASGFSALRNVLVSAQLGSAAVSAVTDVNFQLMARRFNGIPQAGVIRDVVRYMNPRRLEDQKFAVRMGLVAENWTAAAHAMKRYAGDVVGPEWSRMLSDVVLRASGLSAWTQAGRWAFGMEFLSTLADHAGKRFDAMPEPVANSLRRYGVSEGDWRRVSGAMTTRHREVDFLDVAKLGETDADLARRVHRMILTETEFAVPSGNARARAFLRQGQRRGTLGGEIMASIAMYKSFPVTVLHTHFARGLAQPTPRDRLAYLTNLVIGTTLMGAAAVQAKDIIKGRDPREMDTRDFWLAATVQGGGLGIWGDFLFSDVNRAGGGALETAAGPVAALGVDVLQLTVGNVRQAVLGERTNAGREAAAFLERYFPGSSLWYGRLVLERALFDRLQMLADPNWRDAFRRTERNARRNYGQQFFWAPGDAAPARAPDLSNALGDLKP